MGTNPRWIFAGSDGRCDRSGSVQRLMDSLTREWLKSRELEGAAAKQTRGKGVCPSNDSSMPDYLRPLYDDVRITPRGARGVLAQALQEAAGRRIA